MFDDSFLREYFVDFQLMLDWQLSLIELDGRTVDYIDLVRRKIIWNIRTSRVLLDFRLLTLEDESYKSALCILFYELNYMQHVKLHFLPLRVYMYVH